MLFQKQDEEENKQLESNLLSQPLPTNVSAFKNHPLFALRRHLLKYEAIYPPDVPAVGFVKGEEVLPRSSVHVLHTREKWLQSVSITLHLIFHTFSMSFILYIFFLPNFYHVYINVLFLTYSFISASFVLFFNQN